MRHAKPIAGQRTGNTEWRVKLKHEVGAEALDVVFDRVFDDHDVPHMTECLHHPLVTALRLALVPRNLLSTSRSRTSSSPGVGIAAVGTPSSAVSAGDGVSTSSS